jgi:hypothetical protein
MDRQIEMRDRAGADRLASGRARLFLLFIAPLLASLALTFYFYGESLDLSFLGHDTYPLILTSRVQSLSDFRGTFTEEMLDGRYTLGHFYRPVLNLSVALDHALHGLTARGYHLTDILLAAACAFLLARLASGPGRRRLSLAGSLAGLYFLSHPVHLNILPVLARRADTLALLFVLLVLLSSELGGRKGIWLPAVFSFLAAGSKESGAIAPFLLLAARLLAPGESGLARIRKAASAALLSFGALLLFLLARGAVLGGFGGRGPLAPGDFLAHAAGILPAFQRMTYYPYPLFANALPTPAARVSLLFIFLVLSLFLLRRPRARAAALLAWAWLLLGWGIHGFSQALFPWYVLHTVAPFALLFGWFMDEAVRGVRGKGRAAVRIPAAAVCVLLLSLLAEEIRNAPPFERRTEWSEANAKTLRFLESLEKKIRGAPGGSTLEAADLPFLFPVRPGSPIAYVAPLTDYSVQAWAELVFPERKIRAAFPDSPPPPPAPDEVLVVVRRAR